MNAKTSEFISKAIKVHGDKYDYSKVEYINCKIKVIIICKKHGEFTQTPIAHTSNKSGCIKCGIEYVNSILKSDTCDFIKKSKLIHDDNYEYSKVEYKKRNSKVIIICKIHGEFTQCPSEHLAGNGCKKCGFKKISETKTYSNEEFLQKSKEIHNETYDYSMTNYDGIYNNIDIICKTHGLFTIKATNHLRGYGCYNCQIKKQYSKPQMEWLNFIQLNKNINIQHALNGGEFTIPNTRFKADGYCEETNTIYEFHGDYWHGNPNRYNPDDETYFGKSFGELYQKTIEREQMIKNMGFNLITIWESDWIKLNKYVKILQRKFRNSKLH